LPDHRRAADRGVLPERCCVASRGAALPNRCRTARRRSAATRAALPGRGALPRAGALPDAVALYQVGAAPPGGAPLPTVARCRTVARCQTRCRSTEWVPHRSAALRCRPWRVPDGNASPDAMPRCRMALHLRTALRCRPWRVAGAVIRCPAPCCAAEWRCTAKRCSAAARGALPGRYALSDAVPLYQMGAAPPGGTPLPTVARCRMALHRRGAPLPTVARAGR